MSPRAVLVTLVSFVLAVGLLFGLARFSSLDLSVVGQTLSHVRPQGVALLIVLAAVLALLSAERSRMIEKQAGGTAPSRLRAFGLTALGVGLGQVLPVQVSTVLSRAIGSRLLRSPASQRPIIVTLYEQSFDVGVALLLGLGSLAYLVERRIPWPAAAAVSLAVGYLAAGWVAAGLAAVCKAGAARGRIGAWLADLADANLFSPSLARRLMLLATLRLGVTVLMAGLTSWTAGLDVPLGDLAVVVPLVIVATAAPITPAGLGVNEWTYASMLVLLGSPLALGAQWALVNRILVAAASFLIACLAIPLLALDSARSAAEETSTVAKRAQGAGATP